MKLRVEQCDGRVVEIDLAEGAWTVQRGVHLHRLIAPNGLEHFFTPEGHYDGWGSGSNDRA